MLVQAWHPGGSSVLSVDKSKTAILWVWSFLSSWHDFNTSVWIYAGCCYPKTYLHWYPIVLGWNQKPPSYWSWAVVHCQMSNEPIQWFIMKETPSAMPPLQTVLASLFLVSLNILWCCKLMSLTGGYVTPYIYQDIFQMQYMVLLNAYPKNLLKHIIIDPKSPAFCITSI